MTYFKNIKTGRIYRVNLRHKNALIMSKCVFWVRSARYRNADLTGYPFIAVNSTNC
ncbi:hypothetical protein BROOKSBY_50 [Citrobacter phage vB_CfrD_Brooksby]|uniref:Uncharacterized protein n=1 Tax=Citrobacter phage vB_CfrD_Brooksby TaxID=2902661 RepID=A0AC61TP75_9CAUD|nr:hypothetical protein BROOKSBY_50 [Citrobacter phage vB_CfrD_Brooksby]